MTKVDEEIITALVTELQQGMLTEDQLRQGIEDLTARSKAKKQDVLYLQAHNTSPGSRVIGMMLIEDGVLKEGPANSEDWPYQTVLDAVEDGWRIISFPNMALLAVDDREFHGLGFEFILERWR